MSLFVYCYGVGEIHRVQIIVWFLRFFKSFCNGILESGYEISIKQNIYYKPDNKSILLIYPHFNNKKQTKQQ